MSVFMSVGKRLVESRQKIKAFHGSPHDFDKFSTENIGTGEGAQAYGHGLYFAEREGTALTYRDQLTPRDFDYEEYLMEQYKAAESTQDYNRMDMLERAMQHDTPADFRDIASDADYDDDYRQLAADMADEVEGFVNPNGNPVNFGRMYEVDINASPDELLDFDAPLSEQSKQVKNMWSNWKSSAVGKKVAAEMPGNFKGDITGQEMHGLIYEGMVPDPAHQYGRGKVVKESIDTSQYLQDQGVKGIKYADAQTRFSPKGRTNNYVMFDDKTIEIARKYGVMMPVAGAILAGTMTPEQAEAGVVTKAARESMLKFFDEAEVDNAIRQAGSRKSREALTQMPIDDFLALAREGYSPAKAAGISGVSKFDDLPFLNIRSEDGIANITGHEGRHRARRLKELGESTMPVRIKSDIRWDQQDDPTLWDYEQDYPQILFNEDRTKKSPFPFVQGDSNLLDSRALNIEDIPKQTIPTSKQISDDELIKGLFGSSAATAVGAGTVLAPQDAQAGPVANAIHIGQRIIDLGIIKPDQINNPRAIKLATNKYNKLMKENKAFADRERQAYANGFDTVFNPTELPPQKIITPEDLVGKTIAPVRGDRSDLGHLSQVGGQKVDVDVQAGKKFSRQNGGWASAEGIAQGQHGKLLDAAEDTQNDVVAVFNAMGEDSVNFSTPIAQGMFQQIPSLQKLDLADVKKFDGEVRSFKKTTKKKDGTTVVSFPMKDWVGLDHPEAMSQIMGKDGYPKFGALRTVLTKTMSKAHYRDRGFPSYNEMVKAVEDPELAGVNIGDAGTSTYNVDTSKGIEPIDYHDSYSHRMPGDNNGGFEESLPFEIAFPKSYKRYRNTKTKSGKLMSHDQAIVAMNIRKDGYEVADQEWLDNAMTFTENNKKKLAIAGALASGGASAEQQKFESLEAEEQKLRAMRSSSFGKVSSELAAYRRSQLLPSIGTLAQGAVRDTAKGLDYLSGANLTRLLLDPADEGLSRFFAKPISDKISQGAKAVTQPMLFDEADPYSKKRKQDGMDLGGMLFSPL